MKVEKEKYPIHQSPLFKLTTKKRLAEILRISTKDLVLLSEDINYREKLAGEREIQIPKYKLKVVHKRLKEILVRVETPEWLMSGKKGKSIVHNASVHKESKYLLNVDIKGFYKNTTAERLKQSLIYVFKMNGDVAHALAQLLTWNKIVPTGSPSSQLIAYWANKKTFDRIHALAQGSGLKFTVYVDDLSFSSSGPIPQNMPYKIHKELLKVGLSLKQEKTKFFGARDFKIVTGVGITTGGDLAIVNNKRKKIVDLLKSSEIRQNGILRKLFGSLVSSKQIEPNFLESTYQRTKKDIYGPRI